jgi:aryl-alcohol dehydrogenase-like predicted oxidoreductase
VIKQVRNARPGTTLQHIVKLAAPSFDEARFDRLLFRAQLESELKNLGAERIDVVQWLVRQTPNSDETRLAILRQALPELAAEWETLRAVGKVGALTSFPYTPRFAQEVLAAKVCNGLTSYLNLVEPEAGGWLPDMAARGQGFIAIRPIAAGKIRNPRAAIRFALLHPAVASAILSISSASHAEEAVAAVNAVKPDDAEFHHLWKTLAAELQPI